MGNTTQSGGSDRGSMNVLGVKSMYSLQVVETEPEGGAPASITIACNGRVIYSGPSWEEANKTFLHTFYGINYQGGANIQLKDPTLWTQDPFENVLHTHGLEPFRRVA